MIETRKSRQDWAPLGHAHWHHLGQACAHRSDFTESGIDIEGIDGSGQWPEGRAECVQARSHVRPQIQGTREAAKAATLNNARTT